MNDMYTDFIYKENEHYFSSSSCDLCQSSLGGDRYDYIALDADKEIVELSICVDCVYDVEGV